MPMAVDATDREAIEQLHKRDEQASREQDFVMLRSLMDDDAVVLAPGSAPLSGSADLDRSFTKRGDSEPMVAVDAYRFEWQEVEIIADRAIEWGRIIGRTRHLMTGQTGDLAYNVLRVLRRDEAGIWRIYRTIWNEAPVEQGSPD